jgi:hypothetical protein
MEAYQKIIITQFNCATNFRVIGIKEQSDGSVNYTLQSLLKDFGQSKSGSKLIILNSKEIESNPEKFKLH